MTLSQIQKMRRQSGVTLVELLVVMLIVAILAIGLLPTFVKFVVKAQYTTDAVPLVAHLRTQVGLYQYEHGRLPCWKGTEDAIWRIVVDNGAYKYDDSLEPTSFGKDDEGQAPTSLPSYLENIEVQVAEMQGKLLRPENVEFAVVCNTNSYGYAVGVFGDGSDEGLPGNSGYAVLEINFADVQVGQTTTPGNQNTAANDLTGKTAQGYKLVAQWSNYEKGTDRAHFSFTGSDNLAKTVGLPPAAKVLDQTDGKISEDAIAPLKSTTKGGSCVYGTWTFTTPPSGVLASAPASQNP